MMIHCHTKFLSHATLGLGVLCQNWGVAVLQHPCSNTEPPLLAMNKLCYYER